MPMPHGRDKSPEKSRSDIHNLLCMPHVYDKAWPTIKQMTYNSIVKKLVHLSEM